MVPLGTKVPSESVNGCRAFRMTETGHRTFSVWVARGRTTLAKLTCIDPVVPLALTHEAIEAPHLTHGNLRPAFFGDDGLYLFPERSEELGTRGEMIECVRKALDVPDS